MAPFDLHPHAPSGTCRFCQSEALYSKITCDNCGLRLPWADGDADRLGEKCPQCHTFNVYARRECQKCASLLPWHECVAAIYHSTHNADREWLWLALAVLGACLLALLGFMGIAWISAPTHYVPSP